ncbi:hypothetical protein ACEPAH_5772 [Sanghuangporus vaninii]
MVTSCEIKGLAGDTLGKRHDHRSNLIQAFIDSQKRHASAYASEGRKEFSRWVKSCGEEVSKSAKETSTQGVFSSPILKPRNANAPSVVQQTILSSSNDKSCSGGKVKKHDKSALGSAQRASQVQPDRLVKRSKKKSMPLPAETGSGKDKGRSNSEVNQKKRERSESDDEREERLAQRRDRRRHKKEITAPKARGGEKESGYDEEKSTIPSPHKSKNKKSKLPAGLALLHGFSAENISKHRLTMAPMTTSGVFSKGRASVKAKVERKKTPKGSGTFNELDFLNKVPTSVRTKDRAPKLHVKYADSSDSDNSAHLPRSQDLTGHKDAGSAKVSCSASPSKKSSVSTNPNDDKSNYASEVWEIEKEFLQDDAGSGEPSPREKPGSLVINSREWDWCISEAPDKLDDRLPKSAVANQGQGNQLVVKGCSSVVSTISPSQSVSQIVARASPPPAPCTTSKFFTRYDGDNYDIVEEASVKAMRPLERHETPAVEVSVVEIDSEQKALTPQFITLQGLRLVNETKEAPAPKETEELEDAYGQSHPLEGTFEDLEEEILSALGIRADEINSQIFPSEDHLRIQFLANGPEVMNLDSPLHQKRQCRCNTCGIVADNGHEEDLEDLIFTEQDDEEDMHAHAYSGHTLETDALGTLGSPLDAHQNDLDYAYDYDPNYLVAEKMDEALSLAEDCYFYAYPPGPLNPDIEDGSCYAYELDTDISEGQEASSWSCTSDLSNSHEGGSANNIQGDTYLDDPISEDYTDIPSPGDGISTGSYLRLHLDTATEATGPVGSLKEVEVAVAKEFQKSGSSSHIEMGSNENGSRTMENNLSHPVVKSEQIEASILLSSDARNKENLFAPNNAADLSLPIVYKFSRPKAKKPKSETVEAVKMESEPNITKQEEVARADTSVVSSIPANYTIFNSPGDIAYSPEQFLKEGVNMVKAIKAYVKRLGRGSKLRRDVWLREISSLESQGSPSTMIAVCGATGAGKSSALNAILDDNIVPTSGMRACTAVVTEISYHKKKTIEADVSFLSEKEWRDELEVLLDDLLEEDGSFRRTTDLRSEAGVAWHKVHALYPTLTQDRLAIIAQKVPSERLDAILNIDRKIVQLMGSTKKIVTRNSKEFAKQIAKYIDSKDQKRSKKKDNEKKKDGNGPALWPLIRQVNVRCNSRALSTGAVLVDLPGVADANAARSSIARDYMKKADCVWILAPITRAVDDKTAKDLLGDAFKSQLMMRKSAQRDLCLIYFDPDGGFADVESTITFIATKCDDISCSEVIGSLSLEDDPVLEEIEGRITEIRFDMKGWKQKKTEAEKVAKGINQELVTIRSDLTEHREHLKALQEGRSFTPSQPAKPSEKAKNKKRKNPHGGKGGSPKRMKEDLDDAEEVEMTLDPDADEEDGASLDDFIDDDPIKSDSSDFESASDSDSDSASDLDDKSDRNEDTVFELDSDPESPQPDNSSDTLTEEEVKAQVEQKDAELKDARVRLSEARKQWKQAMDMISNLTEKQNNTQREKNAFCSLKRSEFSREVLKEDFRLGLKRLKELDDTAEEKRNPMGFDPSVNLRDYDGINLPVFTISSRDYIRITKQVKGDGNPSCFSSIEDTGILDLQKWCHSLTINSRERAARNFRNQLRVFTTSIKSYIDSFAMVSGADREALRQKWESAHDEALYTMDDYEDDGRDDESDGYDWVYEYGRLVPVARGRSNAPELENTKHSKGDKGIIIRLSEKFAEVIATSVEGMQHAFKDGLEEKCQAGADAAAESAVEISDAFAASMYWSSYRATLRRDGVWRRNLNEELISPMTKTIASSWAKTFETNLFTGFEKESLKVISDLLQEIEESCPKALRNRAHHQAQLCLDEVKVALRKTIDVVSAELTSAQKEVSRGLEPHVRNQLCDGYSLAMQERGRGSVSRQKLVFKNYALVKAMDSMAEKIEVNLAVLWENASDSVHPLQEHTEAVKCVDSILRQLSLWDRAERDRDVLNTMTEN